MRGRIALLTVSSFILILISYSAGQLQGSIGGVVMDETGAPVAGAQVRVDPMDGGPRSDIVRLVESDKSGRFSVSDLALTTYKVFAMKESSGYPNTAAAFYSNHIFPTATLSATAPVVDLVLKVGPPAGVVSGTVRDATTDKPIVDIGVLLRRASDPGNWISMSQRAEFRVLVPPGVDVSLEISAPGYRTWYYGGASDALNRPPIRLKSRKEMRVDIRLEPEEQAEKQQR